MKHKLLKYATTVLTMVLMASSSRICLHLFYQPEEPTGMDSFIAQHRK